VSTRERPRERRALRLLVPASALGLALTALPAAADEPVGWSDAAPVSTLHLLLFTFGLPLAVLLVIALVFLAPGFARGEGMTGKDEHHDDQWFGGRGSANELESGSGDDVQAITGGSGGRW
jgi:hypothetical protein